MYGKMSNELTCENKITELSVADDAHGFARDRGIIGHVGCLLDNELRVDFENDGVGLDEALEVDEADALEVGKMRHPVVVGRRRKMDRVEHRAVVCEQMIRVDHAALVLDKLQRRERRLRALPVTAENLVENQILRRVCVLPQHLGMCPSLKDCGVGMYSRVWHWEFEALGVELGNHEMHLLI